VLLSSHILSEVEQLCRTVTIIKDGRLVETGQVAQMRHLASSTVTAVVPVSARAGLLAALARLGVVTPGLADPGDLQLTLRVPGGVVNAALAALLAAGADSITCTPATLEDLFLRHYEVAAR
jgi:ABC-2 type transport system ATP-binding protein